jgi:hypothetical protein
MQPFFRDLDRQLRRARKEAETLLESRRRNEAKALGAGDYVDQWTSVSALASGIEKVYSGLERALRFIASRIDDDVPNDPEWHVTLLQRMADELPGVRPAVLSGDSLQVLDRLRAFRHRERNSYAQDLDPMRVLEIVDLVLPAVGGVEADVARLRAFFEASDGAARPSSVGP